METIKPKKVFVKRNQVWGKAEILAEEEGNYKIKASGQEYTVAKDANFLEVPKSAAQRYAYREVKERLEGEYISFAKLPDNVKDQLAEGREYIHYSTYTNDGEIKESVKAIQMTYDFSHGSRLDVQIKRNEQVKFEDAKAYNHKFTQQEYDTMLGKGQHILFQGVTKDGEMFDKMAYYEPKLNDIRTKPALSDRTYFFGQKLTEKEANSLNKGEEIQKRIKDKDYLVSYSPKSEKFITKGMDIKKTQKMDVTEEKKKSRYRGVKVG